MKKDYAPDAGLLLLSGLQNVGLMQVQSSLAALVIPTAGIHIAWIRNESGGYMRKFLLLTLLLIISSLLFAGPFGLDFGDSIEEAEAKGAEMLESIRDASVMSCAVSPPKTLSNLTTYFGFFEDTYGLYMVRAFSNLMRSEIEIRNVYNTLKQQLIAAYGEPDEEIDTIVPDSIWDGTSDFAQSF